VPLRLLDSRAARVWTKSVWNGQWTEQNYLKLDRLAWRAGPAISSAEFSWPYGQLLREDDDRYIERVPKSLGGLFVKVEIPQTDTQTGEEADPIYWYGRLWEDHRNRFGSVTGKIWADAEAEEPEERTSRTGHQKLVALGMENELARAYLTQSVVLRDGFERRIDRAIAFNQGGGRRGTPDQQTRPNASPPQGWAVGGDIATKVFAEDLTSASCTYWTAGEIVAYLLKHHTRREFLGFATEIEWRLSIAVENRLLAFQTPALDCHGRTVKEIIDGLIDRRRLAGYYVTVDEDFPGILGPVVYLNVFSFAHERPPIWDVLLGTQTVPINPRQRDWDFESTKELEQAYTVQSRQNLFSVVRAVGARQGRCFSISPADDTLEADWTAGEEAGYEAAASGEAGYGALDRSEKERRNARARASELYSRVYSHFRLPTNWDGRAGDGIGGEKNVVSIDEFHGEIFFNPDPFNPLDFDYAPRQHWRPGIVFENWLPLRAGHDYSGDKISDGAIVDNTPPGKLPDYLRPLVLIKVSDNGAGAPATEYQHVELLNAEGELELIAARGGRDWSCDTRMQEANAGIVVRVTKPGAQHLIAAADFTPLTGVREEPVDLDWRDNLIATVFWLDDSYCEGVYPPQQGDFPVGIHDELRIDLGDAYRKDYVVPGTVVGVANGQLVHSDSGGFIRNDTRRLENVAEVAYMYYRRPRQAFSIMLKHVWQPYPIGDLIRRIGSGSTTEDVNCCVTGLVFDLVAQTTTVETDFAAFDVGLYVAGRPEAF